MTATSTSSTPTGNQTGYEPVGALHCDPSRRTSTGTSRTSPATRCSTRTWSRRSGRSKEAFCLANTDSVDLTVPDAEWKPENTDLVDLVRRLLVAVDPRGARRRLGRHLHAVPRRAVVRPRGLPNGTYYIAVLANPDEPAGGVRTDNNLALREIRLERQARRAQGDRADRSASSRRRGTAAPADGRSGASRGRCGSGARSPSRRRQRPDPGADGEREHRAEREEEQQDQHDRQRAAQHGARRRGAARGGRRPTGTADQASASASAAAMPMKTAGKIWPPNQPVPRHATRRHQLDRDQARGTRSPPAPPPSR